MSKHFGGGGGGGGGRRLEGKGDYPPRRGEDKRPSVFDRLGVRKYEDNVPSSYHGSGDGGSYRRNDGPVPMRKHSPMPNSGPGGRRNQDNRERIRSRSRSRSFSPRSRKVPPDTINHYHSHMGGHGPMKKSKMKDAPPHDHRIRQRSNSPMRRKSDKSITGSSPNPKYDNPNTSRHSKGTGPGGNMGGMGGKSKKGNKKSGGKKSKDKKLAKGKSSDSSGSSGETSSSSRSASSSTTSSEASSSTTSNATSTSDSSVPSIKLRHDKQQKKKKPKRPSSKSESVSTGQIQSRVSSGSSIESGKVRDNRPDLREKIKAKNRQNYERMQDGPSEIRQRRVPSDQYPNNRNYNKPNARGESPGNSRRRKPSGASSSFEEKPPKRRRILTPEEFVPSPRRAPPANDPPSAPYPVRRDRSPMPRERIRAVNSPMRRAPAEDSRRGDGRELNKRLDNYGSSGGGDNKSRDIDRYRDDGPYGRDGNRQKERMAPARSSNTRSQPGPGHQSTPSDRDRDRGLLDRPPSTLNRFETRHPRPLLQLPLGIDPPKMPFRGNHPEDRGLRPPLQLPTPAPKHTPMIVKSKEALIEKYRGMKQSQYVDMWVDKTVEACAPPNIVSPPLKDVPSVTSKSFEEPKDTKNTSAKELDEMLSDFSDDGDEILNDIGDDSKSEKSEKEHADKKGIESETEVVSTVTHSHSTEATLQPEKKTACTTTTPIVVSASLQERKTPQRTSSSFVEGREAQSLPSRSQTEDDILERMDFEEISDEELGDVGENKIPIVDALGVDWASLVCGEKNRPVSPSSVLSAASTSLKVRKRWTSLQVVSRVGLLNNCSETLLQKVIELKMKEEPYSESSEDTTELEERIQDELQNAGKFRKMRARGNVIDTIGLGPNSRALSSRRDMALRRYYLGMPQKNLVSMDMLHQNPSSSSVQDLESIGELYRLSLSLFKGSDSAAVTV